MDKLSFTIKLAIGVFFKVVAVTAILAGAHSG
jgi:hypothetical protein